MNKNGNVPKRDREEKPVSPPLMNMDGNSPELKAILRPERACGT